MIQLNFGIQAGEQNSQDSLQTLLQRALNAFKSGQEADVSFVIVTHRSENQSATLYKHVDFKK